MTLLQSLVKLERELDAARDVVKGLRKTRNTMYAMVLAEADGQHWLCMNCGSVESPANQGEHNQHCARCHSHRVKLVPNEEAAQQRRHTAQEVA